MTMEQIVFRFSQFPFLTSLVVIAVGLLLGFLFAWIFWRRRHRSWKAALQRQSELASEAAGYKSRSRYYQSLLAERQKLAAAMDWSRFDFVSPKLAVKLKEYGIKDLENLNSLSEIQRGKLDSELAVNGLSLNWDSVGKAKASLEQAQNELVKNVDVDWGKVEGIDPQTARELQRMGIKSIGDLEDMSPSERTKFEIELKQKGVNWDWSKLGGWKTALGSVAGITGLGAAVDGASSNARVDAPSGDVDWRKVEGVDAKTAGELQRMGIKSVGDLENMSPSERTKFEAEMKQKGVSWDWGKLGGWKTALGTAAGVTGLAAGVANIGKRAIDKTGDALGAVGNVAGNAADVTVNGAKGLVGGASSSTRVDAGSGDVDWGKVEGVDAKTASELQRLGIKSIGDLENMSPPERTKFEAEMKQKGVSWDWGKLGGWKTALGSAVGVTGLGAAIGGASSNTRVDAGSGDVDWGKVEGVDAKTAGELQRMGIKSIGDLENMSPPERTKFEAEMKQKGVSWDWGKLGGWKTDLNQKSHLKGPHFGRREVRVTGFAPVTEEASKSVPAASNQDFAGGAVANGGAASGFATSNVGGIGASNAGAAGSINVGQVIAQDLKSTEPPRLFKFAPEWRDDLTLLDGIDDPQSRELRKMGIYNFDQLHNLPHLEQARLQAWFGSKGWHLDMDQWRISSEGNTLNPSIELIQDKAYEVYCHRRDHHLCGDESTDWEQAEWAMRGNPIWGYGVPHDVEDYTQTMAGVTQEARDELYRMGLYNRHQVELLNEQERRLLTTWFAGPRFGVDLTKSFGWLSTLRPAPAPSDLNFGAVCESEPNQIDDLSRINGIGNATESDLNRLGIYHFRQIANWTPENTAAVAETLGLGNRIQEDAWIEQAKRLVERG